MAAPPRSESEILKETYKGREPVHCTVYWGAKKDLMNVEEGAVVPPGRTPLYAFARDMKYLAQGYNDTVEALLRTASAPLKRVQMYMSLAEFQVVARGRGYDMGNTLGDGNDSISSERIFLNDLSLGEFQDNMSSLAADLYSQMNFHNVDRFSPGNRKLVVVCHVSFEAPMTWPAKKLNGWGNPVVWVGASDEAGLEKRIFLHGSPRNEDEVKAGPLRNYEWSQPKISSFFSAKK